MCSAYHSHDDDGRTGIVATVPEHPTRRIVLTGSDGWTVTSGNAQKP